MSKLRNESYKSILLNEQLNQQMTSWLQNKQKGMKIVNNQITLSKIFSWYETDFTPIVKQFIKKFVSNETKKEINEASNTLNFFDYNWNSNIFVNF